MNSLGVELSLPALDRRGESNADRTGEFIDTLVGETLIGTSANQIGSNFRDMTPAIWLRLDGRVTSNGSSALERAFGTDACGGYFWRK
jgi:hypothetical protein